MAIQRAIHIDGLGSFLFERNPERLIGTGRFGWVYVAPNEVDPEDTVAVKVLPPGYFEDRKRRTALRHEFRVARGLDHPNVGKVYALIEDDDLMLVTEHVRGPDLRELIEKAGREGVPIPLAKKLDYFVQSVRGLRHLHEYKIFHGDMKPDNLVVSAGGVKLVDYGLVQVGYDKPGFVERMLKRMRGEVDVFGASPSYMSPEQVDKVAITAKSDIYSLGMTFYYLFSGSKWPLFPLISVERQLDEKRMGRLLDRQSVQDDPERIRLIRMTMNDHKSRDIPELLRQSIPDDDIRLPLQGILFKMVRRNRSGKLRREEVDRFYPTYIDADELLRDVVHLRRLARERIEES